MYRGQIAVVVEHHMPQKDHLQGLHVVMEELPSWVHSVEESVEQPSLARHIQVEVDPSEVPFLRTVPSAAVVPCPFEAVPCPFEAVPLLVGPFEADRNRS